MLDVVSVVVGIPGVDAPAGTIATVLDVFDTPPGYEIEVVDSHGKTIFCGAVDVSAVEPLPRSATGDRADPDGRPGD